MLQFIMLFQLTTCDVQLTCKNVINLSCMFQFYTILFSKKTHLQGISYRLCKGQTCFTMIPNIRFLRCHPRVIIYSVSKLSQSDTTVASLLITDTITKARSRKNSILQLLTSTVSSAGVEFMFSS